MLTRIPAGVALTASFALPLLLTAQVTTVPLGAPTGKAVEPFSEVVAMHELRDGRLMVIDNVRSERTIWTIDFRNGAATQFSRRGQGPGEYQEPTSILPLGDSLLIVDPLAQRVLVLSPSYEVARTGLFPRAAGDPTQRRLRDHPRFIDQRGQFYYQFEVFNPDRTGPRLLPMGGIARSSVDRSAEVVLTEWASRGAEQTLMPRSNMGVWPLRDGWAVRPDGFLAKVLADKYEIVWYRDGRETGRVALPTPDTRVTQADRTALIEEYEKVPVMMLGQTGSAGASGRKNPFAEWLRDTPDAFPARKSPIADVEPNVLFDPRGRLWIARGKTVRSPSYSIDVVDESRGLVGRVELPAGHQLIGFGASSLYTVRIDDDGLQWLERFALPKV